MNGSYTAPQEHGILVVFSGPSGAGKGTILKRYFQDDPPAVLSVSATTRAPRPGEVDGVHYHFLSREAFEQLIAEDGVLEYNIYNGNYYGSPRGPIEEELSKGHDVPQRPLHLRGAPLLRGAQKAAHRPRDRDPGGDRRPAGKGPFRDRNGIGLRLHRGQ